MHPSAILHEVQQLYKVSDRLDALAELAKQHPLVSEALMTISGSVRNTASVLEVLVATKMASLSGLDPADARVVIAVLELRFGIEVRGSSREGRHLRSEL